MLRPADLTRSKRPVIVTFGTGAWACTSPVAAARTTRIKTTSVRRRAMRVSFVGKRALLAPGPGAQNKKAAGELTALGLAASRLSGQPDDVIATCCSVAL